MKISFLVTIALLALAGCTRPPQLATSLDIQKQSSDVILLKLKVINLDDRVTVPINIELTGQAEQNGHWDKPSSVLHPAAFVLNRKEERDITELWRVPADAVRTTLVIKEQERGNLLKTEKFEKVFTAAGPSAATSQP